MALYETITSGPNIMLISNHRLNCLRMELRSFYQFQRVEVLEKVIQKWGKVLHPSNLLVVRLKYNLIGW